MRFKYTGSYLAFLFILFANSALGSDMPDGDRAARTFAPYEALVFDSSVVHDVKVEDGKTVYLQLLPDHKEKEIIVKLSNRHMDGYRAWTETGEKQWVSSARQGKEPYGWTDFVRTEATFIEYWMDGALFLHLKRTDR